jgi:Glycosyl hydrolase family 115/Gylcosyl hydrolase family 115 C-terminal domain
MALLALIASAASAANAKPAWIGTTPHAGDFVLVREGRAADLLVAPDDFKVVSIAAHDLAADIAEVTGATAAVRSSAAGLSAQAVIIGTLGKNQAIDALVAAGKLDVSVLRGQWESFLIATVPNPLPGVSLGLVIAGSDRRGTAYGVYELSQAIGVSPWHWWTDVAPEKKSALFIATGTRRFGPPSVKYRGIFLNDEDWGLVPWASKTFEPEAGNVGPKTYAKLFELMLRLKANTVWPAMHPGTKPFNDFPANKQVADDYGIVMGSSHAEPMLRNNVGEWTAPPETYNYITNRDGVLKYWEDRVAANGRYENLYTLGMRGIHDSNMQGPKTDPERIQTLQRIFADQRALLAKYVRPDVEQVPQMFCVYKEVLGLYRQGLKVPDDVTIVWPDDNFGYIRNFASDEERKRTGGFGIYYHLSYLGAPLSYLWLYTTPPALVWEEMTKAYDYGAHTIWIANVGDLKPSEIGTEFFLQLAWDVNRWNRDNLSEYLTGWAKREFGVEHAVEIADVMRDYYRLNYQRKPEHLQWWMPGQPPKPSPLTATETRERLAAFAQLRAQADRLIDRLPPAKRDAFYELVDYPVRGSALANERYFKGEQSALVAASDPALATRLANEAREADRLLTADAAHYNGHLAGGKWRGMVYLEPADNQWRSMRISTWAPPQFTSAPQPAPATGGAIAIEAGHFSRTVAAKGATWAVIPGLGRTGDSVAVFPVTMASVALDHVATDSPRLDYVVKFPATGEFTVNVNLIPTQPIVTANGLRFAAALDDQPPQLVVLNVKDGTADWAQGVLNSTRVVSFKLTVLSTGAHTLRIYGVDPGVVLDKIVIDLGGLQPSYLGPPETDAAP